MKVLTFFFINLFLQQKYEFFLHPKKQTDGNYRLVELASNVAHATSDLVNNVKTITQSSSLEDPNAPESQLVVAATKSAHAATKLVTVARITAPSIQVILVA